MKRVGYLGPKGTYSYEAYNLFYKNEETKPVEYMSINDLIISIQNCEIEEGIVPIENSIEGSVVATMDAILKVDLYIKSEFILSISLNLMAKHGVNKGDITSIYTHPQPVGQCREYLEKNFKGIKIVYTDSTTQGAKVVSDSSECFGAIGPKNMSEMYGLNILEENIQDSDNNETRFVVLSKEYNNATGSDKTSIIFSTDDKPGSLYKILDIFSLWDINLTKIESRPRKEKLGQYVFFVDMEGHIEDEDVTSALTMVKRKTSFYKFLGAYPKWLV